MIKTENQIERDFFTFITQSKLGKCVKGSVYRADTRPDDAKTEDLVVKFLAGLDEQIQSGVVIINIYVPDRANPDTGRKTKHHARIGELQGLIRSFVDDNNNTEYWMETDGTPTSMAVEGIEQHCIIARIKFQRLSTD